MNQKELVMNTTLEVVYQRALLADASYVSFHLDEFIDSSGKIASAAWDQDASNPDDVVTFQDRGFTFEQFQQFQVEYRVLHHQPDTTTGFSATLFEDTATQELYLSFRGTNDLADWAHDAVLALWSTTSSKARLSSVQAAAFFRNTRTASILSDTRSAGISRSGRPMPIPDWWPASIRSTAPVWTTVIRCG